MRKLKNLICVNQLEPIGGGQRVTSAKDSRVTSVIYSENSTTVSRDMTRDYKLR